MSYGFIQDVPANEEMYRQIMDLLPTETPPGLVVHIAVEHEGGLRYIDVWDSEADWERFRVERIEPAVGEVLARYGIPHTHDDVDIQELDVVHTWVADRPVASSAVRD